MVRKVLLLHGNRQTGQLLLGRVGKLRKKLAKIDIEVVAIDGPHETEDDLRCWWHRDGNKLVGLKQSVELVQETWSEDFAGIIGFSQGARLVHLLLCMKGLPGVKFALLASAYEAPMPEDTDFCFDKDAIATPSLHVIGETDEWVSPESSKALLRSYDSPATYLHSGGHHVPMQAAAIQRYVDFIENALSALPNTAEKARKPNEECLEQQLEELEALQAMFPEELTILSDQHPIEFLVSLGEEFESSLKVRYTAAYPNQMPVFSVSNCRPEAKQFVADAVQDDLGMAFVTSMYYAAREFLENTSNEPEPLRVRAPEESDDVEAIVENEPILRPASVERLKQCDLEGQELVKELLKDGNSASNGGSWLYTIGLVGKPSAGKSTLFNTATAFARNPNGQGATMAPHPFTTIDPNIGYCLVPAPDGSCPETPDLTASTHGRDKFGRRLLPVLLKDVAGLVPGAYEGRGRGNQFLNDLTDADVLIHVLDASGLSDADGNKLLESLNPLSDMAWIRKELMEWVFANVSRKWDTIVRRGKAKLLDMFSGYKSSQSMATRVVEAVEKYQDTEDLKSWDEGDLRRLVSVYVGLRFPIAVALNKADLAPSGVFIKEIQDALPIHGTHIGVPMSARKEMQYVRRYVEDTKPTDDESVPAGAWQCLQAAMSLDEPLLVFPVADFVSYAPMAGMIKYATSDASLPSAGMVACLTSAGGTAPSEFDEQNRRYFASKRQTKVSNSTDFALRDALMMKPGSTAENVFLTLKRLGALAGEFVRAEAAGSLGSPPKPIPKHQVLTKQTRIIKIMTNKKAV